MQKKKCTQVKGILGPQCHSGLVLFFTCNNDANTEELKRIYNLHSFTWNAPFTG